LYWDIGYATAVLHGDWKLIVSQRPSAAVELYNLAEDPGETKNLANTNAEKVQELRQVLAKQKGLDP
jgi:arylsulfatase A-like enzyme